MEKPNFGDINSGEGLRPAQNFTASEITDM
jgi:hypothetical protein